MRRPVIYILILLLSCLLIVLWWPMNNGSNCSSLAVLKSKKPKYQVQASQVIVKPWLGQHHVYGIFMLPERYKESPSFVLSVKDVGEFCYRPFGYSQSYDNVVAEPGTYLIRYYILTRMAMKKIFQGGYGELKQPQNWTLTVQEPTKNQLSSTKSQ
jgi:hypothetical protein